jgi:molybdate-binding protein
VALRLARELGETVESLFGEADPHNRKQIETSWPCPESPPRSSTSPRRVVLGRIAGKLIAVPQPPACLWLSPAAGILGQVRAGRAKISTYWPQAEIDSTLIMAGCDPAVGMIADWFARRRSPAVAVPQRCSSSRALAALVSGTAHVAGVHLRDTRSGEYNLRPVREAVGRRPAVLIGFARWELGLAAAPGNPLKLGSFDDLARPRLRIVNRESGSGSRAALDEALRELGLKPAQVSGYERELPGHLEVAAAIAAGEADTGLTIRLAAEACELAFVPLREERYDLVVLEREYDLPPVQAMLEALASARFAREVNQLCGYQTNQMGNVIAHMP